jgi:hypothetical protein
MTRKITPALLRKYRACDEQVAIFETEWPDGTEVTPATVARAIELGLNLEWGVRLLPPRVRAEYHAKVFPIRAQYAARVAPIWAEYHAKVFPIRAQYAARVAPIWAEYHAKVFPIREECDAKVAAIWAECDAKVGPIWAETWNTGRKPQS